MVDFGVVYLMMPVFLLRVNVNYDRSKGLNRWFGLLVAEHTKCKTEKIESGQQQIRHG